MVHLGAALLALGGLLALPAMIPRRAFWRRASRFSALGGVAACLAAAAGTWIAMDRPPVGGRAELLLFLAPAMALAYVAAEGLAKSREAGLPVLMTSAGVALAGWSGLPPPAIAGHLPLELRSGWLPVYLMGGVLAYGFLFTAGVQAVVLLVVREVWPRRAERAGRAVYWSVCLGFPVLLLSMIAAGIWSLGMRGSYWSWTGREMWSLIYCLLLLAYLNVHFVAGWRERRAAWFLMAASLAGLFAFGSLREMPTCRGDISAEAAWARRAGRRRPQHLPSRDPRHQKG
jgi:ABC-type transport system involved in cytochrome c biogenesis permease subunit